VTDSNPPWMRYLEIENERELHLTLRRFRLREAPPVVLLGASLAIAGAAAASRTTIFSLDRTLYLLAAIES
jgi:hypothetical protein